MKTKILMLGIILLSALGCSKDDGPQTPDPKTETEKSSAKQINGFAFRAADNEALEEDVSATIDQNTANITATVPKGADITALMPDIEVSTKASVSPEGTKDFTDPVTFTVTAEDGTTATYQTTVSLLPSSEKQMISFRFLGIESDGVSVDISADIDEENKTITATLPSGTDVTALEPSVEISPGATIDPQGAQDFTDPKNYTVTAGDGSSATYVVTVTVVLTEKEILLLISDANPGNMLDWNIGDNLSDWEEVVIDGSGNIIELDLSLKGLTIVPPEIGLLVNLTDLYLYGNILGTLPPEIGLLVNLTDLYLYGNILGTLPPEIGQLSNLEELDLGNNSLGSIPPEIGQLDNLGYLDLRYNGLMSIPAEIGQLSNLEELHLSNNNLGSIPPEIGQLRNLTRLRLSNNNLRSLPPEIGQLRDLEELNLAGNGGLLRSIPPEIGQLSNLEELYLAGNDLKSIPKAVCDLETSPKGKTDIDIVPGITCDP